MNLTPIILIEKIREGWDQVDTIHDGRFVTLQAIAANHTSAVCKDQQGRMFTVPFDRILNLWSQPQAVIA